MKSRWSGPFSNTDTKRECLIPPFDSARVAHTQLQDRDAAHEAEIELAQMIQENSPFHIGTAPGLGWRYWLICELFLHEIRQARTDAEQ
jgi:hypothetical protein